MRPHSWLAATLLTLLLTGFVLTQAAWRSGLHGHRASCSRHSESHGQLKARKPLSSDAEQPWRRGEPTHWRACLLQQGMGCLGRTDVRAIP